MYGLACGRLISLLNSCKKEEYTCYTYCGISDNNNSNNDNDNDDDDNNNDNNDDDDDNDNYNDNDNDNNNNRVETTYIEYDSTKYYV